MTAMRDSDSVLYWISVDGVVVGRDAGGPAVHVRGERLDPTASARGGEVNRDR
ncbi:hypothetical protein ACFW1M_29150 [Streptomyces inhibens]|uniref:hypothetical protein n=1 Tax=Streptomyces inhibens TaxID=2293571 RepID=UPI0036BDAAC5